MSLLVLILFTSLIKLRIIQNFVILPLLTDKNKKDDDDDEADDDEGDDEDEKKVTHLFYF